MPTAGENDDGLALFSIHGRLHCTMNVHSIKAIQPQSCLQQGSTTIANGSMMMPTTG